MFFQFLMKLMEHLENKLQIDFVERKNTYQGDKRFRFKSELDSPIYIKPVEV